MTAHWLPIRLVLNWMPTKLFSGKWVKFNQHRQCRHSTVLRDNPPSIYYWAHCRLQQNRHWSSNFTMRLNWCRSLVCPSRSWCSCRSRGRLMRSAYARKKLMMTVLLLIFWSAFRDCYIYIYLSILLCTLTLVI